MSKFNALSNIGTFALVCLISLFLTTFSPAHCEDSIDAPPGVGSEAIASFNQGIGLSNAKNYSEAMPKFQEACRQAPGFAEAHAMYGLCLLKLLRAKESIDESAKAYAIDPKLDFVLVNLGSANQMIGHIEEAEMYLQKYLDLYPKGEFAGKATSMIATLQKEIKLRKIVESSKGKDNYLSEATAPGKACWDQLRMPIPVFIQSGDGVKGYQAEYLGILKDAFNQWCTGSGGRIKISFVDKADPLGINCSFIDNPSELVNPMEGGQALISIRDADGVIQKGQIKLLTTNSSFGTGHEKEVLLNICLHEVGHALGIRGHSSQAGDVMFGFMSSPPNLTLSDRDEKTIQQLYSSDQEIGRQ
jgi:outer membrane protein assembly factor BamD (BamD/ComL family)